MNLNNIFTIRSLKLFVINFVLVLVMTIIPHFKIISDKLISPLPSRIDILDKIRPALAQKEDNFELRKSFIPEVSAGSDYDLASAYGLIDFDNGNIIASKNLSERLPIASLTKIMTAVVALDLAKLDDEFNVSTKAASQIPTKVMLAEGEKYSLEDLIKFMMISSANDSAEVIKEGIDQKFGSDVFIKAMNEKARLIGLKNTSFSNPQGFDDTYNFSSIEDLSLLTHYALSIYPYLTEITSKSVIDLTKEGEDMRFYLQNWNGLLGIYPGISGVKIGNTDEAGKTTIVLSERAGKKLLALVLGAPGVIERDLWASQLLDLGFSKLSGLPPINLTEEILRLKYASWKYFE